MTPTIKQQATQLLETSERRNHGESNVELNPKKKRRVEAVLPVGFRTEIREIDAIAVEQPEAARVLSCKQFWKAGDYEGCGDTNKFSGEDMDHLRVHPKFLHSNATSHKWALGAFAELLDNALDETSNGATYVHVDVLDNMKDKSKMVMVQDNGGGMTPSKMRQCMSLGYSAKSKMANTIGQYGNGFKTGTMRLGADVIVFSRCKGTNEGSSTQSIGLLSYTFLRATRKEDIAVPMVDFERSGEAWSMYAKSNPDSWTRNLETILQWSPYESEQDLLHQFNFMSEQGTRIIIYNLWEDEEGLPELDFDSDEYDIQIRREGRDPKKIEEARKHPSCTHFFTYRHSFRSYAAILYRKIPDGFRIILRGKDVDHYNIVDDLIHIREHVYRPAARAGDKDPNLLPTNVKLGFVEASLLDHVDIQGFNVYHKNRLIEPFWRVWNAAGSNGRGVVGVLEANFIKPAHDKQGFERTSLLSRLENRLNHYQKEYWNSKKHLIGYAPRAPARRPVSSENGASTSLPVMRNTHHHRSPPMITNVTSRSELESIMSRSKPSPPVCVVPQSNIPIDEAIVNTTTNKDESTSFSSVVDMIEKLKEDNSSLRERLRIVLQDLQYERVKNKSLENQLEGTKKKLAEMEK